MDTALRVVRTLGGRRGTDKEFLLLHIVEEEGLLLETAQGQSEGVDVVRLVLQDILLYYLLDLLGLQVLLLPLPAVDLVDDQIVVLFLYPEWLTKYIYRSVLRISSLNSSASISMICSGRRELKRLGSWLSVLIVQYRVETPQRWNCCLHVVSCAG